MEISWLVFFLSVDVVQILPNYYQDEQDPDRRRRARPGTDRAISKNGRASKKKAQPSKIPEKNLQCLGISNGTPPTEDAPMYATEI